MSVHCDARLYIAPPHMSLVWETVRAAELHTEPNVLIAGGAALSYVNTAYVPIDVDVFVFGADVIATAARIVNRLVAAAADGNIVVGARNSVVTVWRPHLLPLQIVLTTAVVESNVVESFDINISKVSMKFDAEGAPTLQLSASAETYAPGAVIHAGRRMDWARTRRRIVKYVMAGYTLPPYHCRYDSDHVRDIARSEIDAIVAAGARTPVWFDGMAAANMAAHAVFLGGLEFVFCPGVSNGVASVEDLFARACTAACSFDGSQCEYTHAHSLISPATMIPPYKLAALTDKTASALRTALDTLNQLIPSIATTGFEEASNCKMNLCALTPEAAHGKGYAHHHYS